IPVVQGGAVSFFVGDEKKTVRLVRAHLEEDAGKSDHHFVTWQNSSGDEVTWTNNAGNEGGWQSSWTAIDLNRAGTPLLEIVTEPDMRSSAEAVAYAKELHKIVTWIGICDGNMQEGSFRCDANVSVRKPGAPLGTRREIKNLNSFKFMQQAIDYEVRWQIEQIEDGHAIQQATVLFNPDTGETRAMRTKEDAADYRYFPDPDLPPLVISREWVAQVRHDMAELPRVMAERFVTQYGLPEYDATQLTQSKAMAAYFEEAAKACGQAKLASNWIMGELSRRMNADNLDFSQVQQRISAVHLATLISRINDNTINHNSARQVFEALWSASPHGTNVPLTGVGAVATVGDISHDVTHAASVIDTIIEAKGLKQMNDTGELEKIIDEVLAANPKNVEEFKAGNAKALNGLVGPIMKASKGKANPAQVNALLVKKL
ncbi:MAG: Asp-tRNA(Asn)/Glu-tRNA(Gln) amidotransferase subunit GatB, partial [Betaproteobacteria bacterium]|nr:Asp-tRNA(Asn)/Glu-tRNA(Gln) amidotransferase subunit GatB [Betaproteobacteria bacterium]